MLDICGYRCHRQVRVQIALAPSDRTAESQTAVTEYGVKVLRTKRQIITNYQAIFLAYLLHIANRDDYPDKMVAILFLLSPF